MDIIKGLPSTRICSSLSQVQTAWSMALMDKHKQVKRQRLDRICEGEISYILLHKVKVNILELVCVYELYFVIKMQSIKKKLDCTLHRSSYPYSQTAKPLY